MSSYSIEKVNYVDAYPGYTGFVIDIENIEKSNFFAYFHIEIKKSKEFTVNLFSYEKPMVYFHVYCARKGQKEINKDVLIEMLEWDDLRDKLHNKTVGRVKSNLEIIRRLCDNDGSIIPSVEMKKELDRQITHNGLKI